MLPKLKKELRVRINSTKAKRAITLSHGAEAPRYRKLRRIRLNMIRNVSRDRKTLSLARKKITHLLVVFKLSDLNKLLLNLRGLMTIKLAVDL